MPKFGPADQARLAVEQANKTAEQFIRDFGRLAGIDMDQTGILINAARFPLQRDDPGSLQNLLLVCLIQIENFYSSSARTIKHCEFCYLAFYAQPLFS